MNRWRHAMAMMAAGVLCAGFSAYASVEPPNPSDTPTPDLLSGPTVSDEAANEPQRRRGARPAQANVAQTPLRDWMVALREVDLTDEQRQTMRAIADEMAQERRKFMMERSEPERKMMDDMPRLREQGREPSEAQRQMMQRVEAARPRVEEFQRKMWAQLTPQQQEQFKLKLAEVRERRAAAATNRRDGRRAGDEPGQTMSDQMNPMQDSPASARQRPRPQAPGGDMQSDQTRPAPPASAERDRARRRAANQPDDLAQRRLRFLRSKQSADARNATRHTDGHPSPQERTFTFEEDQAKPQPKAKPDERPKR